MVITKAQKEEIVKLCNEHSEALIAFGGDMHRQGLIKGAIASAVGIGFCTVGLKIVKGLKCKLVKNHN